MGDLSDAEVTAICLEVARRELDAATERLDRAEDELADALQATHYAADLVEHALHAFAAARDPSPDHSSPDLHLTADPRT